MDFTLIAKAIALITATFFGTKFWLIRAERLKINSESVVKISESLKLQAEAKKILIEADSVTVALYENLIKQMKATWKEREHFLIEIINENKKKCEATINHLRKEIDELKKKN